VSWVDPDSELMLAATAGLAAQVSDAVQAFQPAVSLPAPHDLSCLVVMGMGGSAVAGEVLAAYAASRSSLPVVLLNDARPPSWLGPRTVLFAMSFSGNTEETLAVTEAALSAGAPVVGISAGGQLAELLAGEGRPFIRLGVDVSQPRAAAGASIAVLLLACEDLGTLEGAREDLGRSVDQLMKRRDELAGGGGLAAEVARRIGRTIPVIHGGPGLGAVAARRWKTQINENAKSPAISGVQPEVCHNEVCGYGQHGDVTRQLLTLVNLRTGLEGQVVDRRYTIFADMTREALAQVITLQAEGEGELARYFDLMTIGDFVSLHMAAREGVDPGPVPILVEMRRLLATGG
jgi:glucose/mannose-6-phosphate isomerase